MLMTEADVRRHLGAAFPIEVNQCPGGGWTVTLPWGRKVNIYETHIDLRGITRLLPGETEEDREQLQFELMSLDVETFGEIPLIGLRGWEYWKVLTFANAYELPVDENQYRPFTKAHAKYRFGDQAKVGRNWFLCGWKTRSLFDRYNIVSERDLVEAAGKLERHLAEVETERAEATSRQLPAVSKIGPS